MLNQLILVGRLTKDIEINETASGKKIANLELAIPRSFKNANGEYDTDFVNCILWENTAHSTSEYCKKGDIVGIKGRLQSRICEKEDKKENILEVVGEKVTFLTTHKEKDDLDTEIDKKI